MLSKKHVHKQIRHEAKVLLDQAKEPIYLGDVIDRATQLAAETLHSCMAGFQYEDLLLSHAERLRMGQRLKEYLRGK